MCPTNQLRCQLATKYAQLAPLVHKVCSAAYMLCSDILPSMHAGPKGDDGPAGADGLTGLQGRAGSVGAVGAKGNTGDQGSIGLPGPQGPSGNKGMYMC